MTPDPRDRSTLRSGPPPTRSAALAAGTLRQEFRLERVLSEGAFSIVYLAQDEALRRPVVLKEFLPAALALRAADGGVQPRLPGLAAAFDQGLRAFVDEARLLAGFDHPHLQQVHRVWTEAGTAWMATAWLQGMTLERWLTELGARPGEAWLRQLLVPLMDALATLHQQHCLHRDIEPGNVFLLQRRDDGPDAAPWPVLMGLGAAHRVAGGEGLPPAAVPKSGYRPLEQADGQTPLRQGPWTDVYALCAVLYRAVTGQPPPPAADRVVRDELVPARVAARGRCSEPFLAAIDAGLALRPEHRLPTLAALQQALQASEAPPPAPAAQGPPTPWQHRRPLWVWPALAGALLLLAAALGGLWWLP